MSNPHPIPARGLTPPRSRQHAECPPAPLRPLARSRIDRTAGLSDGDSANVSVSVNDDSVRRRLFASPFLATDAPDPDAITHPIQ